MACTVLDQEAAMFPMIRARLDAYRLSRKLRKSLATREDKWKIDTDEEGRPTLSCGDFRIVLVPRAVRRFGANGPNCERGPAPSPGRVRCQWLSLHRDQQ